MVWQTYLDAKTFRVRPSDLLDIRDPYRAYCLDSAVGEFGRSLDAELKDIEGKTKKEVQGKALQLVSRWLKIPMHYRSPRATR